MPRPRDEFSSSVRNTLARRVCYRCSCPDCEKPTVGPHSDPGKVVNLGKAAHITAAASGGPRYDASLSPAQRSSIQNAIWLCTHHSELIDKDQALYPVTLLQDWKATTERLAAAEAFSTNQTKRPEHVVFELTEEDRDFLLSMALPPEETASAILPRVLDAARNDIRTFVNEPGRPTQIVTLSLALWDGTTAVPTNLEGIAQGVSLSENVVLVAPPGTGKTTTLLRLVETVLARDDKMAVYLPLGEWQSKRDDWFDALVRRNAFRAFKAEHLKLLAYEGRLVLVLDGWNELGSDATRDAYKGLQVLRREFPQLGVVIGTRLQAVQHVSGRTVRVEPLNERQQLELARRLRSSDGERLLDQAWRTPGLDELVTIPLYLNALLAGVSGDTLPQTKDEVLLSFARQHESASDKAALLRSELLGLHGDLLSSLGCLANNKRTTTLTEEQARAAITRAVHELQTQQQLTAPLQPAVVLDTLVNTHLLTRKGEAGNIAFQHQQFQEWYASFRVEQLMLGAANRDDKARTELRESVLNWQAWEESTLFACERLSRKDEKGWNAVAEAIVMCLGIDPMLAANMIYRSSPQAWLAVRDCVRAFITNWHTPGECDRAARFIIQAAQPDLADYAWSFLENPDNQVYLHFLRLAKRFRPDILGPKAAERLARLPEGHRKEILVELAMNGDYQGIELVTAIALAEPSPSIVASVVGMLGYRGAGPHISEILKEAGDEVWRALAMRDDVRLTDDPAYRERLKRLRREQIEDEQDPFKRARLLTSLGGEGVEAEQSFRRALASDAVYLTGDKGRALLHDVFEAYPAMAREVVVDRLGRGLELPRDIDAILTSMPIIDEGPIVDRVIAPVARRHFVSPAVRIVGPRTVGVLIDAMAKLGDQLEGQPHDEVRYTEYYGYRDAISASRFAAFLPALMERAHTKDAGVIESLADLISAHGASGEGTRFVLAGSEHAQLVSVLIAWGETLLASETSKTSRHRLARLVSAMRRVPSPDFLPIIGRALRHDEEGWLSERAAQRAGGRRFDLFNYGIQYRNVLSAIGGSEAGSLAQAHLSKVHFGIDAAGVLFDLWQRNQPIDERGFVGIRDYSRVKGNRARSAVADPPRHAMVEAIIAAIGSLGALATLDEERRHVLSLACTARRMSPGMRCSDCEALLALPVAYEAKLELFVAHAQAGGIVSAAQLKEAVAEVLRDAAAKPYLLNGNSNQISAWISLFAFSDAPMKVFESLAALPSFLQEAQRVQNLLLALGNSPHADVPKVLDTLALRNPEVIFEHEWLRALANHGSLEAARSAMRYIFNGKLFERRTHSGYAVAEYLCAFARAHAEVRAELLTRAEGVETGISRGAEDSALLELGEPEAFLAVLRGMGRRRADYDQRLARAIQKLVMGEAPVPGWNGAVEMFGLDASEFRKKLFAMTLDPETTQLAAHCLEEIDENRDEHGSVPDEPRHPDISSGRPWPLLRIEGASLDVSRDRNE